MKMIFEVKENGFLRDFDRLKLFQICYLKTAG
jgi:hypothetical protein